MTYNVLSGMLSLYTTTTLDKMSTCESSDITDAGWCHAMLCCDLLRAPHCILSKREYYQNCSMLGCVTQCSQSAAHLCEQFLQVQQIGFITLGPLRHA